MCQIECVLCSMCSLYVVFKYESAGAARVSPPLSVSLSLYTYIHVYTCIYMHICMYTYIHTYIHTCIYIYIYIYIFSSRTWRWEGGREKSLLNYLFIFGDGREGERQEGSLRLRGGEPVIWFNKVTLSPYVYYIYIYIHICIYTYIYIYIYI